MMEHRLRAAGYIGVEPHTGVIYARAAAHLPEFTATPIGGQWQLAFAWPLRPTADQCAAWNRLYPATPMDIYHGEARITASASDETLAIWGQTITTMVAKCTEWRRATRQRDEGM